jgi:hypothetical protein
VEYRAILGQLNYSDTIMMDVGHYAFVKTYGTQR